MEAHRGDVGIVAFKCNLLRAGQNQSRIVTVGSYRGVLLSGQLVDKDLFVYSSGKKAFAGEE
jgi:hypothetical protein